MADQSSSKLNSQNPDYPDDEQTSYSVVQKPSILYNYKNGHSSSNNSGAQFQISFDEHEEDGEVNSPFSIELDPPTPVPFQRVSSEDELNFYVKRKRAKFIGPYLFGDVIGQGSYAKVKECLDRRNLCRRAVKIMQRRRLRKTPHGEKMAATEIRLLKKLNHPNIIRLYDFIRNDEKQKLYLFIDLCVVSLQEMLDVDEQQQQQTKAFPIWQAHGYFVQLISGLEYLHSKFIIHNDIK
jgi:serine/threonine-protein kinase 11